MFVFTSPLALCRPWTRQFISLWSSCLDFIVNGVCVA